MPITGHNGNEGGNDPAPRQQEPTIQPSLEQDEKGQASPQAPTIGGDVEKVQPSELGNGAQGNDAADCDVSTRPGSRESRRFPLVPTPPLQEEPEKCEVDTDTSSADHESLTDLPSPSQKAIKNLARMSTLSGRKMDLDQLFHIRDSVQLSIEDPSRRGSTVPQSHQAEGAVSSTETLTNGNIPEEVDETFPRPRHSHHGSLPESPAEGTTVACSIIFEKKLDSNSGGSGDGGGKINRPASFSSIDFSEEETIVAWEENDPENPYNWPSPKKTCILITALMLILNSTMGSALPSNAIPFIADEWGVTDGSQKVLPISVYLIGYVMGPILWGPLSEQYGRKIISLGTFALFSLSTLACALAPTWPLFLVFRLLAGIFGSAPLAIVTGIIADIYSDPRTRGRSMGIFMVSNIFGPLLAPIISGFSATTIGWRWSFWIGLMYAGLTMIPLLFMPETFSPILLLRRAKQIRRRHPAARVVAPHELEPKSFTELTTVVLTRPIRMILFEPIVNTSCAYLALCYAILYMTFEAFPTIFQGVYGLSPGICGLTYLSIGVGSLLALPVFFTYDTILSRARARNAAWTKQEEYRRLPLACIGGPMFVISLFWLGWTARDDIPMIIPILAGIPFGLGFMCVFQALLNYLTDAYEIFAASAHAAASTSRSLLATVLPLAAGPMFARLGISGACSLLGGLSLLMCAIPFVFLWQGDRIRANSGFCIELRERKAEMARKIEEQARRKTVRMTMPGLTSSSEGGSASGSGNSSGDEGTTLVKVVGGDEIGCGSASGNGSGHGGVTRTSVQITGAGGSGSRMQITAEATGSGSREAVAVVHVQVAEIRMKEDV
ncbi:Major facilitator superfamily domain containing protein [Naviculisporaceae sp. PSN 640]